MKKTATLNLRVNPIVKQRAKDTLTRLGFAVTLPNAPSALNADSMTVEEVHTKLQEGYDDFQIGKVQNAASAFKKFRENQTDDEITTISGR